MDKLLNKVQKTIQKYQLISKGNKVVVGVSGGPDSVFLLKTLHALQYELGFKFHVAHLNHGLRQSALRETKFVESFCRHLRVTLSVGVLRKNELKLQPGSLEELAREKRFEFFFKVAEAEKASYVVLGHTRDDLAETVLMRLLRGSGLMGSRAILPKRFFGKISFIRPLLEISREEIIRYLKKHHIKFCQDPTNQNKKFFRNKIRLELLPYLKKNYNANIKGVLANLAQISGQDYEYLETETRKQILPIMKSGKKEIFFKLEPLRKLHPSLQRMAIRLGIEKLKGDTNKISYVHLQEVESLLFERPVNSIVDLPDSLALRRGKKSLTLFTKA